MESLFKSVNDLYAAHPAAIFWIAYSGGLDSHVLLHLFANLRSVHPLKLRAVYVNHGMSLNAAEWAKHCEAVCRDLQIDFQLCVLDKTVDQSGASPEDGLRARRYEIFAELLQPNDVLLTAHHQDDQAETVLLQLLRGSGPKGLAAMPKMKKFAKGFHARPLLDFTRDELKNYAEKNSLHWIEDESNLNISFTRNFLRHDVLPLLTKRWPTVSVMLARTASHCAESQDLLDYFTCQDLANSQGSKPNTLSVKKLSDLTLPRRRQVLRSWIQQQNFPLPSAIKMHHILEDVLNARPDKVPCVHWRRVELRRYRDDLYLMSALSEHDNSVQLSWDLRNPLVIKNLGTLEAKQQTGQGMRAGVANVTVRFRQGGEIIQLPGRKCHHDLKKLFQSLGVPPWQRDRVPLIYAGEKLAAVVGFFVAEEFVVEEGEPGWGFGYTSPP